MGLWIASNSSKFQLICPTSVIKEVRCSQRNIDIAGLANWFSIIHSLKNCKLSGALLQNSGNTVEVLTSFRWRSSRPGLLKSFSSSDYSLINIRIAGISYFCQDFFICWVNCYKSLPTFRGHKLSINKQSVLTLEINN